MNRARPPWWTICRAMWNDPGPGARAAHVERAWKEDARCVDPPPGPRGGGNAAGDPTALHLPIGGHAGPYAEAAARAGGRRGRVALATGIPEVGGRAAAGHRPGRGGRSPAPRGTGAARAVG